MRETWKQAVREGAEVVRYRTDDSWQRKWPNGYEKGYGTKWKPSIHMPRWASRIDLEITAVRVERLQDISEVHVLAEGQTDKLAANQIWATHREAFAALWNSLHGPDAWDENPWVWVIEFQRTN